jgi:hydroxyacylglutathione hydrolase
MSLQRLSDKVWKISFISNVYVLDIGQKIVIDTGHPKDHMAIREALERIVKLDEVEIVMFTHLHYDHVGNYRLFPKAKLFASSPEIDSLKTDPAGCVLGCEVLTPSMLLPFKDMHGLHIVDTPGHTAGSVCIWYPHERMLFSGDTLFDGGIGRTDFPSSKPEMMSASLARLRKYRYDILCPGHG